jgi:hypothetical protein
MHIQETAGLLMPDAGSSKTAVAVAIAKLGEPAVVAQFRGGGSFIGTGRALSAAAGRLSYVFGLKASALRGVGSYPMLYLSKLICPAFLQFVPMPELWLGALSLAYFGILACQHCDPDVWQQPTVGQLPCSVLLSRLHDSKGTVPQHLPVSQSPLRRTREPLVHQFR